jgi:hypothetical protein
LGLKEGRILLVMKRSQIDRPDEMSPCGIKQGKMIAQLESIICSLIERRGAETSSFVFDLSDDLAAIQDKTVSGDIFLAKVEKNLQKW